MRGPVEVQVAAELPGGRTVNRLGGRGIQTTRVLAFHLSNPKYVEGDLTAFTEWDVKIMLPLEKAKALLDKLQQQVTDSPIFPASNTIGGAVAGGTRLLACYALVASWICIIIYLWVRFQGVAFGLAAVIALIHDVLVMLGALP